MPLRKSKLPLACVLLAGVVLIGILLATLGWDRAWRGWNVQVGVQRFLDSQVIAAGASSWRDGHDPLTYNPHDIGRRPMNYPRVWQGLFALGFKQEHAEAMGWTLAGLLLVGVWLALPPMGWAEAGITGCAVFSPAVLLGVERGNTDLAVFFVVAVALTVPRTAWNAAWVAAAFALKLFPLAAAAVLCGRSRREAYLGWGLMGAFAVLYVAANIEDLRLINAATPRDTWLSYGLNVWPWRLARASALAGAIAQVAAWLAVGIILWSALRARMGRIGADETDEGEGEAMDAFRVGAACYAGTFLLGNNFIYRLVFLVLAVPQLWRWARVPGAHRLLALLGLVSALGSLWVLGLDRTSWVVRRDEWFWFSIGQAMNWGLFTVLCRLFISTLPDWLVVPWRLPAWGRTSARER